MTVRVFVATSPGTDDLPAEITLEHSLRKNCSEDIEVVFMRNNDDPSNYFGGFNNEGWATPFTNLRWAIPSYCNFEGRAIYMDCDMVNFRDISELFHMDMEDAPLVCREGWRTCVMLMDCEKLEEHLPHIREIKADAKFNQKNAQKFAALAKPIDERWNCLDGEGRSLSDIWHLHWTHMPTQPWKPDWAAVHYANQNIPFTPKDHPRTDLVSAWNKLRREAEGRDTSVDYTVISTLPVNKWAEFGEKFIPTFDAHWPANIKLKIYLEGGTELPVMTSDRVEVLSLEEELPEVFEFQKRNEHRHPGVGNLDVGGPFRVQAAKFCRKAYTILKELEKPASRYVVYMDADIETLKKVPQALLDTITANGTYVSALPRKTVDGIRHTEVGFVVWDTENIYNDEWCAHYRHCWDNDHLFNLKEWHDAIAWDYATEKLRDRIQVLDLGGGVNKWSSHPLNDGPLGKYFNHRKGPNKV